MDAEAAEPENVAEVTGEMPRVTRRRRSLSAEIEDSEIKEKRTTRSRRMSVEKQEENMLTPVKKSLRSRRSSIEKSEDTEPKTPKLPTKSRRRGSISLDPIEEKIEVNRKSNSPQSNGAKAEDPVVLLTPYKKVAEPVQAQLDLSIIEEDSFSEEVKNNTSRSSLQSNKEFSNVLSSPSSKKSSRLSAEKGTKLDSKYNDAELISQRELKSPVEAEELLHKGKKSESSCEISIETPVKGNTEDEEITLQKISDKEEEKQLTTMSDHKIVKTGVKLIEDKEIEKNNSQDNSRLSGNVAKNIDSSVSINAFPSSSEEIIYQSENTCNTPEKTILKTQVDFQQTNLDNMKPQEKSDRESRLASENSIRSSIVQQSPDVITKIDNISRNNRSSENLMSPKDTLDGQKKSLLCISPEGNKENILENTTISPKASKNLKTDLDVDERKFEHSQNRQSVRISDVFRPKGIDYSFAEPMEVDEQSILYRTQNIDTDNTIIELDESKQSIPKTENETIDESIDASFTLHLESAEEKIPVEQVSEVAQDSELKNKIEEKELLEETPTEKMKTDEESGERNNLSVANDTSEFEFHCPSDDDNVCGQEKHPIKCTSTAKGEEESIADPKESDKKLNDIESQDLNQSMGSEQDNLAKSMSDDNYQKHEDSLVPSSDNDDNDMKSVSSEQERINETVNQKMATCEESVCKRKSIESKESENDTNSMPSEQEHINETVNKKMEICEESVCKRKSIDSKNVSVCGNEQELVQGEMTLETSSDDLTTLLSEKMQPVEKHINTALKDDKNESILIEATMEKKSECVSVTEELASKNISEQESESSKNENPANSGMSEELMLSDETSVNPEVDDNINQVIDANEKTMECELPNRNEDNSTLLKSTEEEQLGEPTECKDISQCNKELPSSNDSAPELLQQSIKDINTEIADANSGSTQLESTVEDQLENTCKTAQMESKDTSETTREQESGSNGAQIQISSDLNETSEGLKQVNEEHINPEKECESTNQNDSSTKLESTMEDQDISGCRKDEQSFQDITHSEKEVSYDNLNDTSECVSDNISPDIRKSNLKSIKSEVLSKESKLLKAEKRKKVAKKKVSQLEAGKNLSHIENDDDVLDESENKTAKLGTNIASLNDEYKSDSDKLDMILASISSSSDEDEDNRDRNEFIDDEAMECEEDTPSEDSNQIIDEGESIHSSECDVESIDEYDSNDSFICDDEDHELLSGEEYDLGIDKSEKPNDKSKKPKKSRIINVENNESDIILVNKKKEPVHSKKRSRIVVISSSSDEESSNKKFDDKSDNKIENVSLDILEKSQSNSTESVNKPRKETTRKSSITILENVNINDIKDSALSERISGLVNSFCTQIKKGDISMNLSLQYEGENSSEDCKEKSLSLKEYPNKRRSESDDNTSPIKKMKMGSSLENIRVSKQNLKRRLSKSVENISINKKHNHKRRKIQTHCSSDSFSLFDGLVTDVKNRPKRTIKPSSTEITMNGTWIVDVADVKPSTSIVTKRELEVFKQKKIHPKDFRHQMLYDSSRVKREDSKAMLRKRGAYY